MGVATGVGLVTHGGIDGKRVVVVVQKCRVHE